MLNQLVQQQSEYRSYVLRVWQTDGPNGADWRVSLVSISDDQQQHFSSLDHLLDYLYSVFRIGDPGVTIE